MASEYDGYDRKFNRDDLDLDKTNKQLDNLQPGEALFFTHSGVVINVSGIKLGLDIPSFLAQPLLVDKTTLLPPTVRIL